MNLDQAFRFLNFIANKEMSGKTMTPRDYNANLEMANLELFNKEYQKLRAYARENNLLIFQVTEIGETLRPFVKSFEQAALPASGKLSVPPHFVHARSLWGLYDSKPKEVEIISYEYMVKRMTNPLERSFYDSPAASQYDTHLMVVPKTMTELNMTYLRRPRKPYYAYTQDTNTDGATYIPVEEVRAAATLTVSVTTVVGGEVISISVNDGTNDIVLGSYTGVAGDSAAVAGYGFAAAINERNKAHGYEAEASDAGVVTVYAPIGTISTATLTSTATTTTALSLVVTADFTGGVTGSTQLEWNQDYHMEIYKIILGNMGVNLSEERLMAYQKLFANPSV